MASSPLSPSPIILKMESTGVSGGTGSASSSQPSASILIGNIYSHQVPFQSTTNQVAFMNYYNYLPSPYHHRLE